MSKSEWPKEEKGKDKKNRKNKRQGKEKSVVRENKYYSKVA
jgi:hypothetical protein